MLLFSRMMLTGAFLCQSDNRKERIMGRKRLTQFFPGLLPLRKKQKIFCYYMGMRLDHNRYSEIRSDFMLSHPLFHASWPLYNYKTGYELTYQENKAYNCKLAAKVLDRLIIAPGETFSFWNAVRGADRETAYKNGYVLSDGRLQLLPGGRAVPNEQLFVLAVSAYPADYHRTAYPRDRPPSQYARYSPGD